MIKYVAESTANGVEVLTHYSEHPEDCRPLESVYSGFEWGYEGNGPRQLACALLADLIPRILGDAFMEEVVSQVSPISQHERAVVFREDQIVEWLKRKLATV